MSNESIELKIIKTSPQPIDYQYTNGTICLFITDTRGAKAIIKWLFFMVFNL